MDATRRFLTLLSATAAAALALPALAAAGNVRLVVHFDPGTSAQTRAGVLGDAGATPRRTLSDLGTSVVTVPAADAADALRSLDGAGAVDDAEPAQIVEVAETTPTDPQFQNTFTWAYTRPGFTNAWDVTTGSSAVTVAVVDTGVNPVADLAGALVPGRNIVAGTDDASDDNGHGTEVSGTIAARGNNDVGAAGVCWACRIMPVKVAGSNGQGYDYNVAAGIDWAVDHGAEIVNVSMGQTVSSQVLADAVSYAQAHGVLVVAAAGNAGTASRNYPAGYPGVLSAAASDANDARYSWSSYGSWVSVAAPGCVWTTLANGGYGGVCGTSFSSPLTAGLAALLLSAKPDATAGQIAAAIQMSAVPVSGGWVQQGRIDAVGALAALGISVPALPPANASAPTITGTVQAGKTLTGKAGSWTRASRYAYQWQRCDASGAGCAPIGGATLATYVVGFGDGGHRLRLEVTATGSGGSTSADSAVSGAAPAPPAVTVSPTISGTLRVGNTLAARAGTWTGASSFAYQWRRCSGDGSCAAIAKATAPTYTLVAADLGQTIVFHVTATGLGGSTAADSDPSDTVLQMQAPVAAAVPAVSGQAIAGAPLTGTNGTWTGTAVTLARQWLRCADGSCVPIDGATGSRYLLTGADVGATIVLQVTGTNAGGSTGADSTATATIVPAPIPAATTAPTVSGAGLVGQALRGAAGVWTNGGTQHLQWRRCADDGSCADIAKATALTYTPARADLGFTLVLRVSETNVYGATGTADASTAAPIALPPLPSATVAPTVSGSPVLGQTLTGAKGTWSGAVSVAAQWLRCSADGTACAAVLRANAWTYALATADVGLTVRLQVTATNSAGDTTLWQSDPLGPVTLPPAPSVTGTAAIRGTVSVGSTLTGWAGTWTGVKTFTFQWYRSTDGQTWVPIVGATGGSYKLTTADRHCWVGVQVVAHGLGGETSVDVPPVGPVP